MVDILFGSQISNDCDSYDRWGDDCDDCPDSDGDGECNDYLSACESEAEG